MDVIERLAALEEIQRLKARYCYYIDTKQWGQLAGLFSDDACFEGFGSAPAGSNAAAFVAAVSGRLTDCVSVHHCHSPDIVCSDAVTARGSWAMEDFVQWKRPVPYPEAPGAPGFRGYGHYEEEYRRLDGGWKMAFLRLTRLRIDPLRADHPYPPVGFLAASATWLKQGRD